MKKIHTSMVSAVLLTLLSSSVMADGLADRRNEADMGRHLTQSQAQAAVQSVRQEHREMMQMMQMMDQQAPAAGADSKHHPQGAPAGSPETMKQKMQEKMREHMAPGQ